MYVACTHRGDLVLLVDGLGLLGGVRDARLDAVYDVVLRVQVLGHGGCLYVCVCM